MSIPVLNEMDKIANQTHNDLIIFFILIIIALVIFIIPFYKLILKSKKENNEIQIKKDENLLKIIQENTEVLSSLKVTLENIYKNTDLTLQEINLKLITLEDERNSLDKENFSILTIINNKIDKIQEELNELKKNSLN